MFYRVIIHRVCVQWSWNGCFCLPPCFSCYPLSSNKKVIITPTWFIPVPARISSFGRTILRPFRSTASLLCHAVGQPTLRREWLRGDQILRGGSNLKIQIMDSGELLITDLQQSDSGNYTCQVGNSHGSDHIQYTVIVQGETLYEAHTPEISVWMPTA
jgi:hypothetical protein